MNRRTDWGTFRTLTVRGRQRGRLRGRQRGMLDAGKLVRSSSGTGGRGGHNEIGSIRSIDLFAATVQPVLVHCTYFRTSPTINSI